MLRVLLERLTTELESRFEMLAVYLLKSKPIIRESDVTKVMICPFWFELGCLLVEENALLKVLHNEANAGAQFVQGRAVLKVFATKLKNIKCFLEKRHRAENFLKLVKSLNNCVFFVLFCLFNEFVRFRSRPTSFFEVLKNPIDGESAASTRSIDAGIGQCLLLHLF